MFLNSKKTSNNGCPTRTSYTSYSRCRALGNRYAFLCVRAGRERERQNAKESEGTADCRASLCQGSRTSTPVSFAGWRAWAQTNHWGSPLWIDGKFGERRKLAEDLMLIGQLLPTQARYIACCQIGRKDARLTLTGQRSGERAASLSPSHKSERVSDSQPTSPAQPSHPASFAGLSHPLAPLRVCIHAKRLIPALSNS